ncbi:MAG: GIY-YIG nuclease family protein [Symploca sp. SIO2G7]|nr:GIY-YIG nuclease family protein [Symploca sp. SIO2G7]
MNKSGYVYLIQYPNNHYKIGRSKSPANRLKQLQRTSPQRLYLLHTIRTPDMVALEKALHQQYGTKKDRRGEYFRLSDDDVWAIASLISPKLLDAASQAAE